MARGHAVRVESIASRLCRLLIAIEEVELSQDHTLSSYSFDLTVQHVRVN
jgi:hypothetical protein